MIPPGFPGGFQGPPETVPGGFEAPPRVPRMFCGPQAVSGKFWELPGIFMEGSRAARGLLESSVGHPRVLGRFQMRPLDSRQAPTPGGCVWKVPGPPPEGSRLVPGECHHLSKLVIYNLNLPGGRAKRPAQGEPPREPLSCLLSLQRRPLLPLPARQVGRRPSSRSAPRRTRSGVATRRLSPSCICICPWSPAACRTGAPASMSSLLQRTLPPF